MCFSREAASGWIWTTVTSSPASLRYSLKPITWGSSRSTKSTSSGTLRRSISSAPSFRRLVATKTIGPGIGGQHRRRTVDVAGGDSWRLGARSAGLGGSRERSRSRVSSRSRPTLASVDQDLDLAGVGVEQGGVALLDG